MAEQITSEALTESTSTVLRQKPTNNGSETRTEFVSLPADIKSAIVSYIIRPSDLKNVCLVSHEMHEIAVRFLYESIAFDLGSAGDNRLSAFLQSRNKGLKHVRQIRLYLASSEDCRSMLSDDTCRSQEVQAQFATNMLLEFLPEDVLEEFSWCPWRPFSADNLMLLYRKQRRLKWLEVMDINRDILPEIKNDEKLQKALFQHATKLALYPENSETLKLSGHFIEHVGQKLEELIIHANYPPFSRPTLRPLEDAREINDSATGPGLLTRTMFNHMLPFETCTPFARLKALRLHRVSLRYAADTWCKFVNFQQIECLRVYHCLGADTLFGQLSKAAHLPKKLVVLEFQHKDNADNEALLALDGFLCLVQSIRDLVLDLQGVIALPAVSGICRQSKTLKLLNVHASATGPDTSLLLDTTDAEELIWDEADFEKLCQTCKNLEQLSCAWPSTSLLRARSDKWIRFEQAVSAELKDLVTLHISTWPTTDPTLPRDIYEHLLQALACKMFELSRTQFQAIGQDVWTKNGTLRLIAFGISDRIYEREDSKQQMLFLRSTSSDAEGKEAVHATTVGWCLRQFVEPRSEILDFVLGREARPPVRGSSREFSHDDSDV